LILDFLFTISEIKAGASGKKGGMGWDDLVLVVTASAFGGFNLLLLLLRKSLSQGVDSFSDFSSDINPVIKRSRILHQFIVSVLPDMAVK